MSTVDLVQMLRRNEALDRLAVASTLRRIPVPPECGKPLTVLPEAAPFPGPLAVYASGDGGLWFEVQGVGVSAYANPDKVDRAKIYDFRTYR